MKFNVYELPLESKLYKLYDVIEVPVQLRVVYPQGKTPAIFANAEGFAFLESIFKIASVSMKENCLIRIKDNSKTVESFHAWYPDSTEFHLDLVIFNHQYTQISSKKIKRLLMMLDYCKKKIMNIRVPEVHYKNDNWWSLEGELHVNKRSNFLVISSNSNGYLYMADEADRFCNIEDNEEEYSAHSHLFALCKEEDLLDFRYYYEKS
ncbi:MAG TPA: hypothetical protein PLL17_00920 [Defluviitaleaceae bacterium]|jgi:hypothetical protein|nr:hypothetical protein [Defluviitaleaceae bacterium]HQD49681.1 hypothetical protein [Defluviitaleaceae bacterium]